MEPEGSAPHSQAPATYPYSTNKLLVVYDLYNFIPSEYQYHIFI
jgi:hypothetical protein